MPVFFARKFDPLFNQKIINYLDEQVNEKNITSKASL